MLSVSIKVISLVSLFLTTFVFGIIPLKLRRRDDESDPREHEARDRRRKQLISLATCFAGGAFFASSMLELFPIVEKEFKAVLEKTEFPLAQFGISVGFFLILILEQTIHVMKEKKGTIAAIGEKMSLLGSSEIRVDHSSPCQENISACVRDRDSGESDNDEPSEKHGGHCHSPYQRNCHENNINGQSQAGDVKEDSSRHYCHNTISDCTSAKHHNHRHYLRSYLLLMALSTHALFEGLAVGLFQSVDDMVEVLGPLIMHKCVLSFSIGINLVQHSFPLSMVIKSSFLFSAMSPIGLGLGILMLQFSPLNVGHILSAIFQAIATGTFLYVTFFEIFFHELNGRECHKLLKVLMMIWGYSLVTVAEYFKG